MDVDDAPTDSVQYIWQQPNWPAFRYDEHVVAQELVRAQRAQGVVEGKLAALGFGQRQALAAEAWTQDAVSTAAIEGERLNLEAVRSSVARRLGVTDSNGVNAPRHIDGLLDIMDDAVSNASKPLTHKRLHDWQAALFPTGYSGMRKIRVGTYREHAEPMQIVSGRPGRETVHYEAPPSDRVAHDMAALLKWLNDGRVAPSPVIAAIAHLWFETIHPFEDGNGRVGRVLVDLVLAREIGDTSRFAGISQRLLEKRDGYYHELERAQHGLMDATRWIAWFVCQVRAAWEETSRVVDAALEKARFWLDHREKEITPRQRKVLNILLDAGPCGFVGGMSTRKYESLTGTSRATSSRELIDLEAMGLLKQAGAGRSTRYYINLDGWQPEPRPQPPA